VNPDSANHDEISDYPHDLYVPDERLVTA